ncbi:MAG: biotin--[acetyl-CoA-carboxylase] ligase [Bacilli bacterium]|nr:biotin--[acetyl-CoA-carboxylase] ligase [Bacilli bacterium]MBN2696594.1 biotin--[acetyl-CoA-carboxylase] ligase [Bacilli bacterium]
MSGFVSVILTFDQIDSTNEYLKTNHKTMADHTFVRASYQTEGKGRFNRVWEAEKDKNLLCSLLIKDEFPNESLIRFATRSVVDFLAAQKIDAVIKAPNDIYVDSRKLAGILIERLYTGDKHEATIIGIGINVNQDTFQTPKAVSMANLTSKYYDLSSLALELLQVLKAKYPPV